MTDVVVPVKNLSFAKSRLRDVLAPKDRARLVLAMLQDLLITLRHCDLGDIWLVASDDVVFDLGAGFDTRAIREAGSQGYNHAVKSGLNAVKAQNSVIVLPADLPLIEPRDITCIAGLANPKSRSVGIVPDHHKLGTNGLFLSTPDLIAPNFGIRSFFNHKAAATEMGIDASILPLKNVAMDIDCADDLFELTRIVKRGATATFLRSIAFTKLRPKQQKRGVA